MLNAYKIIAQSMARSAAAPLAVAAVLVGAVHGHADALTNNKILRNFDIIAFGNEYPGKRYKAVLKWAQPIRMGIQGENYPPYFESMLRQHIRDLWQITKHPMELYYSFDMQKQKSWPRISTPRR